MAAKRNIKVYADWEGFAKPLLMGILSSERLKGKEIFSFSYIKEWLDSGYAQYIDPALQLYTGPQYLAEEKSNFGVFLDSSPDRWGRLLMRRREAALARKDGRKENTLFETDYLLGVYDGHRMGGIRFIESEEDNFLSNNSAMASPPWTSLKELEFAFLQLERDDHLRNHGFLLTDKGWILSPAYDINPVTGSTGLKLNISLNDNALELSLALEIAREFQLNSKRAEQIIKKIKNAINKWQIIAEKYKISKAEQALMGGF